jgi:hypothetical protein
MRSRILAMFVSVSILFPLSSIRAHRPLEDPGNATSASTAVIIKDPDISQVIYHEVKKDSTQLWLTFEAKKDYNLYLSIGVPVIERLKTYRPALALIGPGLPDIKLPFEKPSGLGAAVFYTDSVTIPGFFHEPITGTDSWILLEKHVTLPATGRYYVVAFSPEMEPGKLWVAIGEAERWRFEDMFKLPGISAKVRKFHEVR